MWLVALAAAVLAAAGAPSAAWAATGSGVRAASSLAARPAVSGTPTEVIDARTDPQLAGQTLSSGWSPGCEESHPPTCSFSSEGSITVGYGPPKILGDALYNCSEDDYAETAVGASDERGESTSVTESLSLKASLGFLGLAKTSLEFEVFSKQAGEFSTEVTSTNAVAVPPMWKGWTETRVLTAFVGGSFYVTQGVHLVQVKDIDLSFPGYQNPNDKKDVPVEYIGYRTPMTQFDIASRCNSFAGIGGQKLPAMPTGRSTITLCRVVPVAGLGSVSGAGPRPDFITRCAAREVTGTAPPSNGQATATLVRHGRVFAAGTDTNGRIRLTERRPITPGIYTLTIHQRRHLPARRGRPRAATGLTTIAPIAIR